MKRVLLTHNAAFWLLPGAIPEPHILLSLAFRADEMRRLMSEADVSVCASPQLHHKEWYHAGQQRYCCAICKRIKVA